MFLLCLAMLYRVPAGFASEPPSVSQAEKPALQSATTAEAWLVTFGPGQIYWERFGHNAIWLREPAAGIDHTFNFGFFDFDQQDFLLNFLRGHMLYFSVAQSAEREFEFYREQNRSIRLQKLNLNATQYNRLRNYLLYEIKPENRDYHYDYFLSNCSTRVRDALDIALDGDLAAGTKQAGARLDFRDHTRRLTQTQYWYYLGLELALGYPTDYPINRWEEMFLPMVVAGEVADMALSGEQSGQPLVTQDKMLFTSSLPEPPAEPGSTWLRYLLSWFLAVGAAWLSVRFMPPTWLAGLSNAWLLIAGSSGLILAFLWLFTDHAVASPNANILLFNPLMLLALLPALNKAGGWLLVAGVAINLIMLLLPAHQYNLDVLMLLGPINLAVAGYFMVDRR